MSAADWLNRSVSRLGGDKKVPKTLVVPAVATPATTPPRSTNERLAATLRQKEEALSPRVLRRTLQEL